MPLLPGSHGGRSMNTTCDITSIVKSRGIGGIHTVYDFGLSQLTGLVLLIWSAYLTSQKERGGAFTLMGYANQVRWHEAVCDKSTAQQGSCNQIYHYPVFMSVFQEPLIWNGTSHSKFVPPTLINSIRQSPETFLQADPI